MGNYIVEIKIPLFQKFIVYFGPFQSWQFSPELFNTFINMPHYPYLHLVNFGEDTRVYSVKILNMQYSISATFNHLKLLLI